VSLTGEPTPGVAAVALVLLTMRVASTLTSCVSCAIKLPHRSISATPEIAVIFLTNYPQNNLRTLAKMLDLMRRVTIRSSHTIVCIPEQVPRASNAYLPARLAS